MFDANLPDTLRKVLEIRAKVAPLMMLRRNVVGVGVGYKIAGQELTDEPSVVVSVTRKQPVDTLSPEDLVPPEVDGVPTDVVETGRIVAHNVNRRIRQRPLRPGLSIGHPAGSAGTLGAFVLKEGQLYLLGNNHVMARLNQAQIGDPILQPGPSDGGTLFDQVAHLADFVPLRFLDEMTLPDEPEEARGLAGLLRAISRLFGGARNGGAPAQPPFLPLPPTNTVDAAIARPVEGVPLDATIIDVEAPPSGLALPELRKRVIKSGRTTGLTRAQILQIGVTVDVQYGQRVARFTNQIMTTALSDRGDSGSLVMDYKRRAIGLLFSGSSTVSVVNPIHFVLEALGVELVTEDVL